MKRWIARAASFYPRSWREEYGPEFDALLDDLRPGWRVFANVLGGAIKMQMTMGTNWVKLALATALFGAIVAGCASFTVAPHYVSSAVISVAPQPDPVRPTSAQVVEQRAAQHFAQMETEILSRTSLAGIIQDSSLDLYKEERQRMPFEDVIETMRRNIRISGVSPTAFSISFDYPDQAKAQATVRALAAKFTVSSANYNRNRENVYQNFWHDEAAEAAAIHHVKLAAPPPPPTGAIISVLDTASLPKEPVNPARLVFLAWGLGAGLLLGLLAALGVRWPRAFWQLAGFAAAGCVLAGAASFLIPNRYTSTAVMQLTPTQLTEDPLAPPPPTTPAAEFLRQSEPQIVSIRNLSRIVQDPRLDLYPKERAQRPIENVVRNMLARDIRVDAAGSAFSISFSYPDRVKAHDTVQALLTAFQDQTLNKSRAKVMQMSDKAKEIFQRKAGENLAVLDPPSLPISPVSPNRWVIAAAGLGIGLLLGAIVLGIRRPRTPALQPAY